MGQISLASWSPATMANATPSSMTSTAARAAALAASILRLEPMDPLQSDHHDLGPVRGAGGGDAGRPLGSPAAATVTTASTTSAPAARYWFWNVSAVNGAPPRASGGGHGAASSARMAPRGPRAPVPRRCCRCRPRRRPTPPAARTRRRTGPARRARADTRQRPRPGRRRSVRSSTGRRCPGHHQVAGLGGELGQVGVDRRGVGAQPGGDGMARRAGQRVGGIGALGHRRRGHAVVAGDLAGRPAARRAGVGPEQVAAGVAHVGTWTTRPAAATATTMVQAGWVPSSGQLGSPSAGTATAASVAWATAAARSSGPPKGRPPSVRRRRPRRRPRPGGGWGWRTPRRTRPAPATPRRWWPAPRCPRCGGGAGPGGWRRPGSPCPRRRPARGPCARSSCSSRRRRSGRRSGGRCRAGTPAGSRPARSGSSSPARGRGRGGRRWRPRTPRRNGRRASGPRRRSGRRRFRLGHGGRAHHRLQGRVRAAASSSSWRRAGLGVASARSSSAASSASPARSGGRPAGRRPRPPPRPGRARPGPRRTGRRPARHRPRSGSAWVPPAPPRPPPRPPPGPSGRPPWPGRRGSAPRCAAGGRAGPRSGPGRVLGPAEGHQRVGQAGHRRAPRRVGDRHLLVEVRRLGQPLGVAGGDQGGGVGQRAVASSPGAVA